MNSQHRAVRPLMRRSASLSILAALAVVALSGCFKLDMQMEIQSDNTVDGSVVIAVAKDQAELLGGEDAIREQLQSETDGLFSDAPESGEFDQQDYEDDDWIGTESTFSGVPLDEFAGQETGDLSITREGDEFVVDGSMDLSTGSEDEGTQAILDSAEIDISIAFPGDVIEANGDIDGNTVSWAPKPGEVLDISARGSAESGFPWAMFAAIGALVVLVIIGIVLFVTMRRRGPAADGPVDGPVDGAVDGPGLVGPPPGSPPVPPTSPPAPPSPPGPPAPPAPPPGPTAGPPSGP